MRAALVALAVLAGACATQKAVAPPPPVETVSDGTPNQKAVLLFEDAVKALNEQRAAKAVDVAALERRFKAVLEVDPGLAEAHYNLGVLAERGGRATEAAALYREALKRKPSLKPAAENLAVLTQNLGDVKAAEQMLADIAAKYPEDASSRARLAEMKRRAGDNEGALAMAREALFRDPRSIQAFKTMILVAVDQKKYSLARLIALRALKIDEADPEVYYALGVLAAAEGDPLKARAQFKKAVEVQPDYVPGHYELARMAFQLEDYQKAEEHLLRILQLGGAKPELLVNLGVAYKSMGQLDKAQQTYDEAAKLSPELPELALNKGIIVALKGEPEQAIALFKSYLTKKGGETAVGVEHPVHELIEQQQKAIARRAEEKRLMEEAARMEAEAKKMEEEAAAQEKAQKDAELKKQLDEAKGGTAPPPGVEPPAPQKKDGEPAPADPPPPKS